ncbi:Uncharacterised protein [Legionella pneumophila]|nr:Uncharacterised protein [Legionella pneumophila]
MPFAPIVSIYNFLILEYRGKRQDLTLNAYANSNHIEAMLDGVNTETGRIGYVALTRARNLFVLGVPNNKINNIRPRLIDLWD